jgi:hypothetical protein
MGRPPGRGEWKARTVLLTPEDDRLAEALAAKHGISVAAAIRQAIRNEARREKVEA